MAILRLRIEFFYFCTRSSSYIRSRRLRVAQICRYRGSSTYYRLRELAPTPEWELTQPRARVKAVQTAEACLRHVRRLAAVDVADLSLALCFRGIHCWRDESESAICCRRHRRCQCPSLLRSSSCAVPQSLLCSAVSFVIKV